MPRSGFGGQGVGYGHGPGIGYGRGLWGHGHGYRVPWAYSNPWYGYYPVDCTCLSGDTVEQCTQKRLNCDLVKF